MKRIRHNCKISSNLRGRKLCALKGSSGRRMLRSTRRGIEVLELIFALPILFIGTLAIFEIGILLIVQQTVATAAIEGAREAAEGADVNDVAVIVDQFLGVHNLSATPAGNVRITLEQFGNPTTEAGNTTDIPCTPQGPSLNSGEVRVTVCVRVTDPAGTDLPVPNWLKSFGFSLEGKTFEVSSLALTE